MSTAFQQVETLLPKLSIGEKAQLLNWVASELSGIFPGIEKTAGVCGGDACITRTRIPVWSLINSMKLGISDPVLLESYPTLTAEDLTNARNYYRSNRAEIERQIQENDEA